MGAAAVEHLRGLVPTASFNPLRKSAVARGVWFVRLSIREQEFFATARRLSERYGRRPPPRVGDGPFDAMWRWQPTTEEGRLSVEELCSQNSLRVTLAGEDADVLELVHARWMEAEDLARRCGPTMRDMLGGVRVITAFHGTTRGVAEAILRSGFAVLGALDPGYFGSGIYVTTDFEYAAKYAQARAGEGAERAPTVLVCVVCTGHTRPLNGGWTGKALGPGFDSHVVFVQNTGRAQSLADWRPSADVSEWNRRLTYCELVVRESAQLLPLAMVGAKLAEEECGADE